MEDKTTEWQKSVVLAIKARRGDRTLCERLSATSGAASLTGNLRHRTRINH